MIIIKTGKKEWGNKHETFVEKIKDMYVVANEPGLNALEAYNDCTKNFQKLLQEAIDTRVPLKLLGAGWSWSKISSAENGLMIDTKQLNTSMTISAQSVLPTYKGDSKKLLFSQCGNGVWELSKELRPRNLSLKASGASNGQTIAGVIATGAHGSAYDVGAVQDFVKGLHIIVSPTRHIYLEPKSAPVVSPSFIQKLKTELVQDDEMFNAAIVSMGGFGIIHGVMIETDDLFLLECYLRKMPLDASLKSLMSTLDFTNSNLPYGSERPYHFAVNINPYDLQGGAFVYSFYKRPYRSDYTKPTSNTGGIGPGDDAPCFIGKLTQAAPLLVPKLVTALLANSLKPYEKIFGTLGEIFNNTSLHGKLLSAAIGVSIKDVNKVIDLLFALIKSQGPFAGLFAFRFVRQTKATLGFTRFNPTCVFELDGAFSAETSRFFRAAWKKLEEENIEFTVHWGKVNEVDNAAIKKMYGNSVDRWLTARNALIEPASRNAMANTTLKTWGLA